jgi:hypothetical protein
MNLYAALQKFKISETELNVVNYFTLFKRVPRLDFYYKMFERLLLDIEKNFEPHISYNSIKPSAVDSYSYEFWLNKTASLHIRKQKDLNKWNWYISFCSGFYDCSLFTTSVYSQRYGSYNWNKKEDLNYEILKDNKERCKQTFGKLFSVYKTIKNNYEEYIELLNTKLVSYKKRKGIILRKTYIELNRKLPEDYQDRVSTWLDAPANACIIQKCLKYLKKPIKCIDKITTRQFFEACRAYYKANPDWFKADEFLKLHPRASAKDWYHKFADGRDDGLTDVDEDSHLDYLEWAAERGKYRFNGHHPWEIERGSSVSLDVHLYIEKEIDKGYHFVLSFHPLRVPELVNGFVFMRELGIPVEISYYENLGKLLRCEDYISIVEEHGDIVHGYGDTFDYRHLPYKSASFIKNIIWKPIEYNEKLVIKRKKI